MKTRRIDDALDRQKKLTVVLDLLEFVVDGPDQLPVDLRLELPSLSAPHRQHGRRKLVAFVDPTGSATYSVERAA